MGSLVGAEAGKQLEAFAARRAFVRLLARVCDLVDFQALRVAEGFPAGEARKMLLSVV